MNRYTGDSVDKFNKLARGLVDEFCDGLNNGVNVLAAKQLAEEAEAEYRKSKRLSFFVRFLTFNICGLILYFHFWR